MAEEMELTVDSVKIQSQYRYSSSTRRRRSSEGRGSELRSLFNKLLKSFLIEICDIDIISSPIPPVIGDGRSVDLLKLFFLVRENGGYNAVTSKGLWDMVAMECGHGSKLAAFVRLAYINYLDSLDLWLDKVVYGNSGVSDIDYLCDGALIPLAAAFKELLLVKMDSQEFRSRCELTMIGKMDSSERAKYIGIDVDDDEPLHTDSAKRGVDFGRLRGDVESNAIDSFVDGDEGEGFGQNLAFNSMESMVGNADKSKKCNDRDEDEEVIELDSDCLGTNISSSKRRCESTPKLLNWLLGIARNPFDPLVVPLPDSSKWQSHGNEELWKQVLMVREGLSIVRHVNLTSKQSVLQKNQKMHPCMYDDYIESSYNLREKMKCAKEFHLSGPHSSSSVTRTKSSSSGTEGHCYGNSLAENSIFEHPVEKQIPVGTRFQAEVPERSDLVSEFDPKWLGTRTWPQDNIDKRIIVEREPIGKGRQDTCGCEVPKSIECVRFHVTERKSRLKRELGQAFNHWRFDEIGEEIACSWTEAEAKKFKLIMRSEASSVANCKWDAIIKFFPTKRRDDLVSYYYNVYLLQQRARQNRESPENINSGDEEEDDRDTFENCSVKLPDSLCSVKKRCRTIG